MFQIFRGTWDKVQSESKVLEEEVSLHWVSALHTNVTENPTLSKACLQDKLLADIWKFRLLKGVLTIPRSSKSVSLCLNYLENVFSLRFIWCLMTKTMYLSTHHNVFWCTQQCTFCCMPAFLWESGISALGLQWVPAWPALNKTPGNRVSNELPWETLHTFCHNLTGSSPCVTPLGRREFMPGVLCTSPNTLLPLCTYFVFFSYNKS